jgi:hypothetical protein
MMMLDELNFELTDAEGGVTGKMSEQTSPCSVHRGILPNDFASIWHGGFPDEPSLFVELGIHSTDVVNNLKVILLPMSPVRKVDDNFLVGMLFFCCFASTLLLLGKVRFEMVYLIGLTGFAVLYYLFRFMSMGGGGISAPHLFTALSYCTIPLIPFVLIVAVFGLRAKATTIGSVPLVVWSAYSATRYVMTQLVAEEITGLVFMPLFLFYAFLFLLPIY